MYIIMHVYYLIRGTNVHNFCSVEHIDYSPLPSRSLAFINRLLCFVALIQRLRLEPRPDQNAMWLSLSFFFYFCLLPPSAPHTPCQRQLLHLFHFPFRFSLPQCTFKEGNDCCLCVCVSEREPDENCGGSTADLSPLNNGSLRRRRRRWRLWLRSRSIAFQLNLLMCPFCALVLFFVPIPLPPSLSLQASRCLSLCVLLACFAVCSHSGRIEFFLGSCKNLQTEEHLDHTCQERERESEIRREGEQYGMSTTLASSLAIVVASC